MVDLGFYLLAQQRFFPRDRGGLDPAQTHDRRRRADGRGVGAGRRGSLRRGGLESLRHHPRLFDQRLRLGWYAGIRKLGFRFRPQLRAGVTAHLPGLELAAGLAQRIRPTTLDPARAVELAARESWLNRLVRPTGWDAFVEGALRYVLKEPTGYQGESMSGRAGFFARRDEIPGYKEFGLRFSAETESDFTDEIRFAIGLGLEHMPTGIATMLQSSRSARPREPLSPIDTSGGLFVAGTVESPTQLFVDSMMTQARLVSDDWEVIHVLDRRRSQIEQKLRLFGTPGFSVTTARQALESIDRTMREREARFGVMGDRLADYLESRRVAYSIKHWSPREGDLHGPLDPQVLLSARTQLFLRLQELSNDLTRSANRLQELRARRATVQENMRTVASLNAREPGPGRLHRGALEPGAASPGRVVAGQRLPRCLPARSRQRSPGQGGQPPGAGSSRPRPAPVERHAPGHGPALPHARPCVQRGPLSTRSAARSGRAGGGFFLRRGAWLWLRSRGSSRASASARQLASMMFGETPMVLQRSPRQADSMSTRVLAPVAASGSRMRTL